VVNNDLAKIRELLVAKADPSGRDGLGRTPLHLGCMSGSIEGSLLLIDAGAQLTARIADGRTPLHVACEYGRAVIVEAILKRTAQNKKLMEMEKGTVKDR
jgi:ankyrin repeat protein